MKSPKNLTMCGREGTNIKPENSPFGHELARTKLAILVGQSATGKTSTALTLAAKITGSIK